MRVTILGAGASSGTPSIEAGWGECDPANPKNRRTRPSILVHHDDKMILIDTSPDLREQLLREDVTRLDGVLLTHAHADHLHGIDDLRGINRRMNAALDLWADGDTLAIVEQRFPYVLSPLREGATVYYKPTLTAHQFEPLAWFTVAGVEVLPFAQDHGFSTTHGFRLGDLAYTTDLVGLPADSLAALAGVKTWIVGAFSWEAHPTHLHIDGVLALREQLRPETTVITHMSPKIDYAALSDYVPDGVVVAYDGLGIDA